MYITLSDHQMDPKTRAREEAAATMAEDFGVIENTLHQQPIVYIPARSNSAPLTVMLELPQYKAPDTVMPVLCPHS